jgi:hypothetical protein
MLSLLKFSRYKLAAGLPWPECYELMTKRTSTYIECYCCIYNICSKLQFCAPVHILVACKSSLSRTISFELSCTNLVASKIRLNNACLLSAYYLYVGYCCAPQVNQLWAWDLDVWIDNTAGICHPYNSYKCVSKAKCLYSFSLQFSL